MTATATIPVWCAMGDTPLKPEHAQAVPVLVTGAGPVGLSVALDLARKGHQVIVLTRLNFIAAGSKAICFSKRTLDIWDRLQVGQAMVEKGVVWNLGKVFWGDQPEPIYEFDMLPVKDQKMPGFINLQQYHAEEILVQALEAEPNAELRWGHELVALEQDADMVHASVRTAQGDYRIDAEWMIACDGARSTTRELLGLDFDGRVFEDNFLIADVKLKNDRPAERWFWFDPPFNRGQSALFHKQPDDVWRLDFQLGWDVDRAACTKPENVEPYVRGMLGPNVPFSAEWYSVYTFQCRRMKRFLHDRVIFAGDSAHLVSPFGARGCNGGIADIDNLSWKLDLVLRQQVGAGLLESYDYEAVVTADENILNSTRSTDFLTPKSPVSRAFRDAVLELASEFAFGRAFVNSGRLSTAVSYPGSSLNTADEADATWYGLAPGSPALDAPACDGWLLERLGERFVLLANGWKDTVPGCADLLDIAQWNNADAIVERYDLKPGSAYLIRPDQYVAARWRKPDVVSVGKAFRRATGA